MTFKAYPITVEPILKEQVWGGNALAAFVKLPKGKKIGEAWFMADQQGNESVISNGIYEGKPLSCLMQEHAAGVLGPKLAEKYGHKFPLLFKFIDSRDRLSIQVHPDNDLAAKMGMGTGKTEAWYVIDSGLGAYVRLGFRRQISGDKIAKMAREGMIKNVMKKYPTHRGDSFLIPAGTVHSIGPSNLIYEIQQNADSTFRLYDWGRKNLGVKRELHIDGAVAAIKFGQGAGKYNNRKITAGGLKLKRLASCQYFNLTEAAMEKGKKYWYNSNSPLVLAVVGGEAELEQDGNRWRMKKGAVALLPFAFGAFMLKAVKKAKYVMTEIL